MKKGILVSVSVLLGLVVSSGLANAVMPYEVTDLGTLGGSESHAWNVGPSGQVVGHSSTAGGNLHAFLWLPEPAPAYGLSAGMNDLGTLGGSYSSAFEINASWQVASSAHIAGGALHGALWDPVNGMQDLGASGANGINASGQVVGTSSHAVLWDNGVMTDLGTLGGAQSWGMGINASGEVVGAAKNASGNDHAFIITPQNGVWYRDDNLDGANDLMTNLNTLGASRSWAYRINVSGQVVGWADGNAFLWENGVMQDLGPGQAFGINASGQVVGWKDGHAFLWEDDAAFDLNDLIPSGSGWVLVSAESINDVGQIVGWGSHDGQTHAFLLTPIPEPGTMALLALGVLGLVLRRRAR